ncbi:MAG: PAS domain S-box protein [Rubrivivax sp.]|nr:PAS domain S-box protein [Rubrivivax sp.]
MGIAQRSPPPATGSTSTSACARVGYARHELMMRTFKDITHPDDLDRDLGVMEQMLAEVCSTLHTLQKRDMSHKDGHRLDLSNRFLVRKADGDPDYFVSVVEGISELKRAEEQTSPPFAGCRTEL